jgi:hypothetical protein
MAAGDTFAVVIPVYRAHLSNEERLSLRHLEHFLPEVDRILVMPDTLDFGRDGYRESRFAAAFFDGVAAYNRLMLSRDFYERFAHYDFILIHQLDAIIFSSDVERFLRMGVDYIGAPWVDYDANGRPFFTSVGNGGFSLRRVEAFLKLLDSPIPKMSPWEYYRRRYSVGGRRRRLVGLYRASLTGLGMRHSIRSSVARRVRRENRVDFAAETYDLTVGGFEDNFIAAEAPLFSPGFTIGTVDQALEFAFEREPRFCYKEAGGRMPLGAHAWATHDRAFWEPHLLR